MLLVRDNGEFEITQLKLAESNCIEVGKGSVNQQKKEEEAIVIGSFPPLLHFSQMLVPRKMFKIIHWLNTDKIFFFLFKTMDKKE